MDVAGLIGEASQYGKGLMPSRYAIYNLGNTTTLDFNTLKDIGRMYCSFKSTNGPIAGSYYWGVFNIGWSGTHLIQIACACLDSAYMKIYARSLCGNSGWTEWKQIV